MSQLFATFGLNVSLLITQAINFCVTLGILWYFLYRPILRIIDERREKIAEGVRTAQAANQKLEDAKQEGNRMIGDAAREAEGLVASARTRADERAGEIVKTAQSRADQLLKETEARAVEEKRRMIAESQKDIARAAMLAAEKVLREKTA